MNRRTLSLTLFAGAALAIGAFAGARIAASHARARNALTTKPGARRLLVPHANGSITLDGDMDDTGWLHATARTGAFVGADGNAARPYSDARFVWGDGHLYLALYAADGDIRATRTEHDAPLWLEDAFHLVFTDAKSERSIDVSPLGTVTDAIRAAGSQGPFDYAWSSGAHVSHEADGTPNNPSDMDEEWVIEMAIPFESLGLEGKRGEQIALTIRRCDTPKHASRVCGNWNGDDGGVLVLD
jgi:hypothetical protein